jgi:SAM-dependent methyltransferase
MTEIASSAPAAGSAPPQLPPLSLAARICIALVKPFVDGPLRRWNARLLPVGQRYESCERYEADRLESMDEYRALLRPFCSFEGKTVVELGCSEGYLLEAFLADQTFEAIGVDNDPDALQFARMRRGNLIRFLQSTDASIPLPDESVDVIYSIDTFEHLMALREMMLDCHRILRPGGRMLILFGPYYNPYGAHLEDTVPVPWLNTVFSMRTLLEVAAHLHERGDLEPAFYWYDSFTGEQRPNPYLDRERWERFLNHITVRSFRRTLRSLPFEVAHFEKIGFGGKTFPLARHAQVLAKLPLLEELFTKNVFCVLDKRR